MSRGRTSRTALAGVAAILLASLYAAAPAGSDPGERLAIQGCKVKAELKFRNANAIGSGVAECERSRNEMRLKLTMKSPQDSTERADRTGHDTRRLDLRVVNGCHTGWLYYVRAVLVTGNLKVESDRTGVREC
jgi:hypothetical protein